MMIGSYYIFFWGKEREGGGGINNMIIKVLLLLIYAKVPFWPSGQFSWFFSWSNEEKSSLWLLHFSAVHKIQFKHSRRKKVSVTKEKGKQINDVFALSRPSSKIFSSRISIYLNLWHESKLQKNSIHFFSPYYAYWVVANQGKGKSGCLCQDEVSNFLSPTCCPLGRSH